MGAVETKSLVNLVEGKADGGPVMTWRYESPVGELTAGATEDGICYLGFAGEAPPKKLTKAASARNAETREGRNSHLSLLEKELKRYFAGKLQYFSVPVVLSGTPFQMASWDALAAIPYGETRSYAQQAKAVGRPTAVRAVASANHANPVGIIVPCHRVIGSNGTLTGYGGGLWRKEWLLNLEGSR